MSDSPISDYRSNEGSTKYSRKMKPSKNCNISVSEANANRNVPTLNAVLPNYSHVFYSRSYKGGYMVCGNTTQIYILKYNYLQSFFFIFQILLNYITFRLLNIIYIEEYLVSNKAN